MKITQQRIQPLVPIAPEKPFSAYQSSVDSTQAEIAKAHRLNDLDFKEQDGILYAKRRSGTTLFVLGHIWSWLTSFFHDDNRQNLKALFAEQGQASENEFTQLLKAPTPEKVNHLVRHHQALAASFQKVNQLAGSKPIDVPGPVSLADRIVQQMQAIPKDELDKLRSLESGGDTPLDPAIKHQLLTLQGVVNAIEQSQFKNDFNRLIQEFRLNYEFFLLRKHESAFPIVYESNPFASFSSLPPDVIRTIIHQFSFQERALLARICKTMSRVVFTDNPGSSHEEYIRKFRTFPFERRQKILKDLLLTKHVQISPKLIDALINCHLEHTPREKVYEEAAYFLKTGRMKSLTLSRAFFNTGMNEGTMYEECANCLTQLQALIKEAQLTHLKFDTITGGHQGIVNAIQTIIANSTHLTHLVIGFASVNQSIGLEQYFPVTLPQHSTLQSVRVIWGTVTPEMLQRLPTTLKNLEFKQSLINEQGCFDALQKIENLDSLTLDVSLPNGGLEFKSPKYLKRLHFANRKRNGRDEGVDIKRFGAISHLEKLESLILNNFWPCSDDECTALIPSTLKSLVITRCQSLTEKFFTYMPQLKQLQSLVIKESNWRLKLSGEIVEAIPAEVNFEIDNRYLNESGLRAYMKRYPSKFRLVSIPWGEDGAYLNGAPPCIHKLYIDARLSVDHFENLSKQTNLSLIVLTTSDRHFYSKEHLKHLPVSIKNLYFRGQLSQHQISIEGFSHLSQLRVLGLAGKFDAAGIETLPISLEELVLERCSVDNNGDESIAKLGRLENLTSLVLRGNSIKGTTLATLPRSLKVLTLDAQVDDQQLKNLQHLQLIALILEFNANVTGATFYKLPMTLETLVLRHCNKIENRHLEDLKAARPNLQVVVEQQS